MKQVDLHHNFFLFNTSAVKHHLTKLSLFLLPHGNRKHQRCRGNTLRQACCWQACCSIHIQGCRVVLHTLLQEISLDQVPSHTCTAAQIVTRAHRYLGALWMSTTVEHISRTLAASRRLTKVNHEVKALLTETAAE